MNLREDARLMLNKFLQSNGFEPSELDDDFNLLDAIDSVLLVELVVSTEDFLETKLEKYVPLADENTFDWEKSPFSSINNWFSYVAMASK